MSSGPLFDLKYPIGLYSPPNEITHDHIALWIDQIATLPERVRKAVESITEEQLNTQYRPNGWTVRQVIHHIPDSHVNSYIRFKWALTEDNPTIKAYNEADWAELFDTKDNSIDVSLDFLEIVHKKLVNVLKSMNADQLKRTFTHPENGNNISLDWNIGMYAWHGEHHLAHIDSIVNK